MEKKLLLSSLVSSCKTTNLNDQDVTNNKVKNIQLVVEYYGDLTDRNNMPIKYTIDLVISPNATMAEFISAFYKRTGLESYYTLSGGAPPNQRSFKTPYSHQVNDTMVNPDNEKRPLKEWNVNNNSMVVMKVMDGGMFD